MRIIKGRQHGHRPRHRKRKAVSRADSEWSHLEVEIDTANPVYRQRRKNTALWWIVICALLVGSAVAYGCRYGYEWLLSRNEEFVLRKLSVQTSGSLERQEILTLAGVALDDNLMALQLDEIRGRLESDPRIAAAEVSRELPDRLDVVVEERVPAAWISCPPQGVKFGDPERGFLIDEQGKVFRRDRLPNELVETLPVFEALQLPALEDGVSLDSIAVRTAVGILADLAEVLRENDPSSGSVSSVHKVQIRNEWSLRVHLQQPDRQIIIPIHDTERAIDDLGRILKAGNEGSLAAFSSLDLTSSRNIGITFSGPIKDAAFDDPSKANLPTVTSSRVDRERSEPLTTGEKSLDRREIQRNRHLQSILQSD